MLWSGPDSVLSDEAECSTEMNPSVHVLCISESLFTLDRVSTPEITLKNLLANPDRFNQKEDLIGQFTIFLDLLLTQDTSTTHLSLQENNALVYSPQANHPKRYNIIFLDFDGVIYPFNREEFHLERKQTDAFTEINRDPGYHQHCIQQYGCNVSTLSKILAFSPEAIKRITHLCEQFDAKIVVSSNWRKMKSVAQLQNLLAIWGLGKYVIDKTDDLDNRGHEIRRWLNNHANQVKQYIILDDQISDISTKFQHQSYVHCDGNEGFTEENFNEATTKIKRPRVIIKRRVKKSSTVSGLSL